MELTEEVRALCATLTMMDMPPMMWHNKSKAQHDLLARVFPSGDSNEHVSVAINIDQYGVRYIRVDIPTIFGDKFGKHWFAEALLFLGSFRGRMSRELHVDSATQVVICQPLPQTPPVPFEDSEPRYDSPAGPRWKFRFVADRVLAYIDLLNTAVSHAPHH